MCIYDYQPTDNCPNERNIYRNHDDDTDTKNNNNYNDNNRNPQRHNENKPTATKKTNNK